MYLYPYRDRVVVSSTALEPTQRTARINARSLDAAAVCHRVREAYTAGNDRIEITDPDGFDRDLRRELTGLVDRLIGMAIQVEDRDRVVAHDLLDPTDVSLSQSTTQLRQHALEVHQEAIEAFCAHNETLAKRVIDRVADIDRQVAFVTRGFYRGLEDVTEISRFNVDRSSAFQQYQIARALKAVGTHAERIATVSLSQPAPPGDDLAAELEAVETDARTALTLALEGDSDRAITAQSAVLEVIDDLEGALTAGEYSEAETHLYGPVLENVRRTAELSTEIPHGHTDD
ncbi:PhoU domain-containing protein [Natrialbaceae archaeon A-gly3]